MTGFDSTAVGCATDASESGYKAKLGYVVAAFRSGATLPVSLFPCHVLRLARYPKSAHCLNPVPLH